jgi:transcription elongation factor
MNTLIQPVMPIVRTTRKAMLANLMASVGDLMTGAYGDGRELAHVWRNVNGMIDAIVTNDETAIRAEFRGGSTPYFLGDHMDTLDALSDGGHAFILFIDADEGTPEPTSQRILIHSKDLSW